MALHRILVIGPTGYIGQHIAAASLALHHPTFLLVRPSSASHPSKAQLLHSLQASGAVVLHGSLDDHGSLVEAVSKVDVVISAVGGPQILDQIKLVAAIKEVGNIKRFLPSEFGLDVDRGLANDTLNFLLGNKAKVRRTIEESGIPYTYVSSNSFAGYFLSNLGDLEASSPPRDKVTIYGDGNTKVVFVTEEDIGTYTIKTVQDPRTENKIVYIRPPANILTQREIVAIWERKIGKELEKKTLPEEEIVKKLQELPFPQNIGLAFRHSIFVKGDEVFEIGSNGVEASELYPDVKYTTGEEYLDRFL